MWLDFDVRETTVDALYHWRKSYYRLWILVNTSWWRICFSFCLLEMQSKWCNATFLQIWWRNKLILILDDPRVRSTSSCLCDQMYSIVVMTLWRAIIWTQMKKHDGQSCFNGFMMSNVFQGVNDKRHFIRTSRPAVGLVERTPQPLDSWVWETLTVNHIITSSSFHLSVNIFVSSTTY